MSPYAISPLLCTTLAFVLGIFVFLKNPKSPLNRSFALLCLGTFNWQICWFMLYYATGDIQKDILVKIAYSTILFLPFIYYHFIVRLLNMIKEMVWIRTCYSICIFWLMLLWTTDKFIAGHIQYTWGNYGKAGALHPLYLVFVTLAIVRGVYLLKVSTAEPMLSVISRNQNKFVFLAVCLFCVATVEYLINYGVDFYPIGVYFILASFLVIAYAIVKYQLMGIEVAGKYLLAWALSLISVGAIIFLGSLPFREIIVAHKFNPLEISIILIAGALIFSPLIRRLDQIFGKHLGVRLDYRPALQRYTDTGLTSAYDVKQLSNSMVKTLTDTLKMGSCSLMLLDRNKKQYYISASSGFKEPVPELSLDESSALISFLKRKVNSGIAIKDELDKILPTKEANLVIKDLEKLKASVSLPLFMRDKLMGILNLGAKRSGEVYTREELTFISTVGKESAVIIQLFEVIEAYQTGRIRTESLKLMAQLLGAIYHEIRNLLVSISSFIQLFRANLYKTKEDLEQALERSSFDIQRALTVAEAVGLYRKNSESKEIKSEDIRKTIDEALLRAKEELPSAKVEVSVDMPEDLPYVQGQLTFSDLFFNLIMNSYYALDVRGGGRLKIKAKRIKDETRPIEVQLSDTGGYLSEVMKKGTAFGGEESPERSGVGGINFFLAKLITNDHGAALEVIDNKEGGATFVVRLPLVQPQEPEI